MSWWSRWFQRGPRTSGHPPSANGASSMHLVWAVPTDEPLIEVSAVLEVVEAPAVPALHFWAIQASFAGGGAAHLGLQWGADPRRPGPHHANWGGYAATGTELTGTQSPLPSSTANVNTRDFEWSPGVPYRLRIARGATGWLGEVTDTVTGVATVIRELDGPGDTLGSPIVWSEIFARCDDPSVRVRWSELQAVTAGRATVAATSVRTSYQSYADGGCDNTTAVPDGGGIAQVTNTLRGTPPGTDLPLPPA